MKRRGRAQRTAFADALRRHRLASGLAQAALAHRAGISASLIALLELGQRQPRRDKILAIARALALGSHKTDRLLHLAGLAPLSPSIDAALDPGPVARAIEDLLGDHRLSSKQRIIAEALLETFARWLRGELVKGNLQLLLPR